MHAARRDVHQCAWQALEALLVLLVVVACAFYGERQRVEVVALRSELTRLCGAGAATP